jgi:4-amino-4-deoxy-L-arabinose transferase-like glycosyltransferase
MSAKSLLTKSALYKHRHIIGFFLVAFMIYIFVAFGFARSPIGLSELELHSLALSGSFSFPNSFIDLPYHFLQHLSILAFGPSVFGIRLVSVLLGMLTCGLVVASIKNLLHSNVAIVSGLIVSSSVFFLNYARLGAPMMMSMFLLALAIFAITKYLTTEKNRTLWILVMVFATILGVYSPMGIYLLVALILIAALHPKARLLVKRLKVWQTLLAATIAVLMLLPLVLAIGNQPSLLLAVIGADNLAYAPTDVWHNLQAMIMPWSIDSFGLVTPFFNIVEIALVIIGMVTLIQQFFSARSQLFLGFGGLAFVISMFNITNSYIMFIPYVFLMAFGIRTIIDKWYTLFPVNPYAKFFGLVPIGILVFGLIFSNFSQYNMSNYYDKNVISTRNETYQIVRHELTQMRAHSVSLVVNSADVGLYNTLKAEFANITVGSSIDSRAETQIFIPPTFYQKSTPPTRIITNGNSDDFVVLKIYQKTK